MKIEVEMMRARAKELLDKSNYFKKIAFDRLAEDFKKDSELFIRAIEIIEGYEKEKEVEAEIPQNDVSAPGDSEV